MPDARKHPKHFWGELAPCEHLLQLYENDEVFLDALEGFVRGGLDHGEAVIVIATQRHLAGLHHRLDTHRVNWQEARASDQYLPLDASEMLDKFLIDGWPRKDLFTRVITGLLKRARGNGRKVRAFGEMVAIMWARNEQVATLHLERLWEEICRAEQFPLFCAYPSDGLTRSLGLGVKDICAAHSRIVGDGHAAASSRLSEAS